MADLCGAPGAHALPHSKFFHFHALFGKNFITARKRSLGQGNIFSSVCQEFCSWGVSTWAGTPPGQVYLPWAVTPPWAGNPPTSLAGTLLGRYTPWAGTPSRQVHPPRTGTPLGPGTPPPRPGTPPWPGTPPPEQVPPGTRYTPWAGNPHLPGRYTPQAGTPPGQVHPQAGTPPRQVHPPGQVYPREQCMLEIRATSGRYASYWNAFLLNNRLAHPLRKWCPPLWNPGSATGVYDLGGCETVRNLKRLTAISCNIFNINCYTLKRKQCCNTLILFSVQVFHPTNLIVAT